MTKRALAFPVRETTLRGYELACDQCNIVVQINHDVREQFPRHRCGSQITGFNIALELDALVTRETRIDTLWHLR